MSLYNFKSVGAWIVNNQSWLFSGAGVSFVGLIAWLFKKKPNNGLSQSAKNVNKSEQAGRDIIHQTGYSAKEVKDLFVCLFQNFPQLQEEAKKIALENLQKFMQVFLNETKLFQLQDSEAFSDPDMQYILYKAIQSAVRKDNDALRRMLAKLLAKRIESRLDVEKLLLNEAIETTSKLTKNQLDIITLSFLTYDYMNHVTVKSWQDLNNYFEIYVRPFLKINVNEIDRRHIIYCGCASAEMGFGKPRYSQILKNQYPILFMDLSSYESGLQLYVDKLVKENLTLGNDLIELTSNSYIWSLDLTSIGILIANTHLENTLGHDYKLDLESYYNDVTKTEYFSSKLQNSQHRSQH